MNDVAKIVIVRLDFVEATLTQQLINLLVSVVYILLFPIISAVQETAMDYSDIWKSAQETRWL